MFKNFFPCLFEFVFITFCRITTLILTVMLYWNGIDLKTWLKIIQTMLYLKTPEA